MNILYCQSRVRCADENNESKPKNLQFSREDRKRTLANIQSAHGGISKKQAKQILRNPDRTLRTTNRTWLYCDCRQPKSQECVHEKCKICCRKLCAEINVKCEKHRIRNPKVSVSNQSEEPKIVIPEVVEPNDKTEILAES